MKTKDYPRDKCEWDLVGLVKQLIIDQYVAWSQTQGTDAYNLAVYQSYVTRYSSMSLDDFLKNPLWGYRVVTAIRRYRQGSDPIPQEW